MTYAVLQGKFSDIGADGMSGRGERRYHSFQLPVVPDIDGSEEPSLTYTTPSLAHQATGNQGSLPIVGSPSLPIPFDVTKDFGLYFKWQ